MSKFSISEIGTMTPEKLANYVQVAKKYVRIAHGIAFLIPGKTDDELIDALDQFITVVEPVVSEQWVSDLINSIVDLFKGNESPSEAVKAFVTTLKARV